MKNATDYAMFFSPDNLAVPFNKCNDLNKRYHSQALQDLFVLSCLDGKQNGTFLELGCDHPFNISNTYLLESQFNWKGVSVDINPQSKTLFNESGRTTQVLIQDATKLDFDNIISRLNTYHIDYLSLDLEPASITLQSLQSIPFNKINFSVITFEHDAYRFGDEARIPSRKLLQEKGYRLICENVDRFEDWYVNPEYVDLERIKAFVCTGNHNSAADIVFKQT